MRELVRSEEKERDREKRERACAIEAESETDRKTGRWKESREREGSEKD